MYCYQGSKSLLLERYGSITSM
ncbi:hypothetical protein COMA1_10594 [Candidatus Nitrospira nitrosa]|uniref:Uncharacterized protein n=1 Tax=Candidatus Nitrospira nitrosa TaxID=1742972 RepID=A0A0S4L599_9BACT|nr:hypothetical protein COMA1_10594 [Candidatus Nitrospira nitrosa]